MNVGDLKRLLEDFDDDQVIRVAHQPHWPLREVVSAVRMNEPEMDEETETAHMEALRAGDYAAAGRILAEHNGDPIVWLVLGGHPHGDESPYAPREVFNF